MYLVALLVLLNCTPGNGKTYFSIFECYDAAFLISKDAKCYHQNDLSCRLRRSFMKYDRRRECRQTCIPQG